MTAALATNAAPARLPESKAKADPERDGAAPTADAKPKALAVDSGRAGHGELADAKDPGSLTDVRKSGKARPGAGVDQIASDRITKQDKQVTKLADRADRAFEQLVRQRDIIKDAVAFGDKGAAAQAFGRARELFAQIVAIGNEAQINMSSNTDSEALVAAKERISHRVTYAYEWANLIEEAMPGDQTL